MGGYGSLWLTASGQVRPRAVGTLSAALWTRYQDSAPGAFDDAADFAEHDVFPLRPRLAGVPLRMDCGTDDPFIGANREFVAGVEPAPAGAFEPGYHDVDYWTRLIPDHLDFMGRHLSA
jgi:S-formylglutathione hydrolase FrmB